MATKSPHKTGVRWFRWLLRLTVLLLLLAGWGILKGIPGSWVSTYLTHNRGVPGLLELGDVAWRFGHGWGMDYVVWYSPYDLTRPLIQAEDISWQPGRGGKPSRVRVSRGSLSTELGMWTGRLGVQQSLSIEDIEGDVIWNDELLTLEGVQFLFSGVQVRLDGALEREVRSETTSPGWQIEGSWIQRVSRSLIPVVRGLEAYSSTTVPLLWVKASGPQSNPTLQFELMQPEGFDLRGNAFSSVQAKGVLENRVLTLSDVKVMASETERLSGNAEVDFQNRMFDFSLENTLNREALEALSPISLDALLSNIDVRVEGQASFSVRVGPMSFDTPGRRVRGAFVVQDASYRDAFFPAATFELDWEYPHLQIPSFSGSIGAGEQNGNVSGSLEIHGGTGLLRLNLAGAADPAQAVSLVGAEVESLIREWEFKSVPPEFQLDVDQPAGGGPLKLNLVARAKDAVWRGTLFHNVRAVASMDEEGLRIRDVTATRAGHLLEGGLSFPPDLSSCTFTLESNFPLPDVLPLLGQRAVDVVRSVRFLGPTRFSASGRADLSGKNDHDISGEALLERVALNWMWFETLSSPFVLKGQMLDLPEIQGGAVGGTLEAEVRLRDLFSSEGTFDTQITVREVDLFELVTRATDTTSTVYTGILGLDLSLQGAMYDTLETRRATTLNGEGRIEIREGELFRIPLLLGLSSILNKITKGFGYASQGDLDADFLIEQGQLSSKNVFVGGSVMSIAGSGGYEFDTRGISGNLKVQLLKDGIMSDALRVLLWPIRKLIEVQVTGTLDNPDWRPRNLPKELFGK